MKQRVQPLKKIIHLFVISMMGQTSLYAGGFSLYTEGSAAAIGNFAAGIAAEGADASIGLYNPAGLVLLKNQQALIGGVGVFPSISLSGTSTYTTQNPFGGAPLEYIQSFNHVQAGKNALVPSLHYAVPLNPRFVFGFSLDAPFGLETDYSENSALRYAATLSRFETINASPQIGGLLTDYLSLGLGLDLQYARVEYNRMIGSPAVMEVFDLPANTIDSLTYNKGSSFAVGFHAGVLFQYDEHHTRVGLNFQSAMNHQFSGYSRLTGRLADPSLELLDPLTANPNASYRSNTLFSNNISLPNIVTLSGYRDINPKWALLGSVVYFGWDTFKTVTLNNAAVGIPVPGEGHTVLTTASATSIENYRNTWRAAIGANYHMTDALMLRTGFGYDETPTVYQTRDVRLPDADRWAFSIGGHYQMTPSLGFDLGYTYLLPVSNARIDNTQQIGATSTNNVTAVAHNNAQLVGVQVVWTEKTTQDLIK